MLIDDTLRELADREGGPRLTLDEIVAALGRHGFDALLLVLALPNAIGVGTIPGASTLFALPQIVLSAQLLLGRPQPWLPRALGRRSIDRAAFRRATARTLPTLGRIERLLRPRLQALTGAPARLAIGGLCLVLALVVALPIPLANQPPAIAIALLALGLMARDGLAVALGVTAGCAALALCGAVLAGGAAALGWLLG